MAFFFCSLDNTFDKVLQFRQPYIIFVLFALVTNSIPFTIIASFSVTLDPDVTLIKACKTQLCNTNMTDEKLWLDHGPQV